MNNYSSANRGIFQNEELAKQLVAFEGLRFKGRNGMANVTPTDIDGLVQLDNENCFIFFELKHSGGMAGGQSDALTRLCDAVQRGGVDCALILAVHNTPYPEKIMAKDAKVIKVYLNGKWYLERDNRTLKEIAEGFINYIKEEKNK